MRSQLSYHPHSRLWLGLLTALVLLAVGLSSAVWLPSATNAAADNMDPVTAAWEKAKAAGSYNFTSDVTQKSIPIATITNVGRSSHSEAFYLEGQNDLRAQTMELTLWSGGGSALNPESGVSLRTEGGKSFTRRGAEAWQEGDNIVAGFAPQGDFLGYLAAIRAVTAGTTETRNGITFTRYSFTLDGPAFAAYMHDQMMAAMRAKGELPPGVTLEPSPYYQAMTGAGELWVGENGLPLRQILDLRFPEQKDERVEARMTVNFSNYGAEQASLLTLLRSGQWQGAWLVLPSRMPDLTGLWLGLTLSVTAFFVMRYRRVRTVQIALVTAVIVSQIVGPILSVTTQVNFFAAQRAKAASQEATQAAATEEHDLRTALQTAPEFNPNQNPLAAIASGQWESVTQSPNLQTTDPGTDTDADGLTDFVEERVGTSLADPDSDGDTLNDKIEVDGFTFGGQRWYSDPQVADSNTDGQNDLLEWGLNANGSRRTTPLDTDGDGLPDLFDPDNDNDGVPDAKDQAPFAKSAVAYSDSAPLQLSLKNLASGAPTTVEFQLRPQDEKQLWFAFNVLDWPRDNEGKIQDIDNKTYADVALSQGRSPEPAEANGDMKLIPMLEIRMADGGAQLPPQNELTPFSISVNNFTSDGSTKVAYVPLTVVTDEQTGARVAFSAQMRYLPTSVWNTAHSVRLAWVVQALIDQPCDKTVDTSADCQDDGVRNNVPMMIQSYYSNWSLTGLTVREDHGTTMAIIYEDPTVDDNLQHDSALWALSFALDGHFLYPRDANNNGVRDLKLADFGPRFDRDNNPTAAQRMDVPNILQVETQNYATLDQAVASTTMTATKRILNDRFVTPVTNNRAIKPLLLFAQEVKQRALGLDSSTLANGYVTQSGAGLTFDMAPSGQPAQSTDVDAGLKWMAYCSPATGAVTLDPCADDVYWDVLEARYAPLASLPNDDEASWVKSRLTFAQLYYVSLRTGYYTAVEEATQIISGRYTLEDEPATATVIRASLLSLSSVPLLATQAFFRLFPLYLPSLAQPLPKNAALMGYGKFLRQEITNARNGVRLDRQGKAYPLGSADAKTNLRLGKYLTIRYRLAQAGVAGAALLAIGQIVTMLPNLSTTERSAVGGITIALSLTLNVVMPTLSLNRVITSTGSNSRAMNAIFGKVQSSTSVLRKAAIVGSVIGVATVWGFFIYGAATAGYGPASPQLTKAFTEAVAATVIIVLLAILSANPVGAIIVGIVTLIDLILTFACELGVEQLRDAPLLGGACFSLTTAATKVLAYFLYNYEPMIDTGRSDLMVVGNPNVTLTDPSKGYVSANTLTIQLPVTTTIVHKNPDPSAGLYINAYLWLFSPDNLRSSTFKYGLSTAGPATFPVDLNQMSSAWQSVTEDHKYVLTPMYRGVASTNPAPLTNVPLKQGINSTVPFSMTMNFAIPAYECWPMWIPLTPIVIPVCYTRELENSTTVPFTILKEDILPATLAEFLAVGTKTDGGLGQSWDTQIGSLPDADGDGLLAAIYNGLDPNDALWDSDNDALSDRYELELRAAGLGISPLQRDIDNDGLSDRQEILFGTDPAIADTDNDGLPDGQEVRHQVYGANGLTANWQGGWQVRINANPPFDLWVSSDPFSQDGDNDGVSDQAERGLANQVDSKNRPYHPSIPNVPPLAVRTATNDGDGYFGPGQSFRYTTTVIADTAVAPGVLNISAPTVVGGAPNPLALNFSTGLTVTQAAAGFAVANNATTQNITMRSTATTRLAATGASEWVWTTPTTEAGLGTFSGRLARSIAVAPAPDRQDSYRLAALASTQLGLNGGRGDVWGYNLPAGAARLLDTDGASATTTRGNMPPAIACNASNVCLAVWEERPANAGVNSDLLGVLIQADGTVTTAAFTIASGSADASGHSSAKVASDGVNFLVAWQRLVVLPIGPPTASSLNFQTNLMTRLYNGQGTALTAATMLANELIEATSNDINVVSGLNRSRYGHNQLDLDWIGNRYRLTRWFAMDDPTLAINVNLKENGFATVPQRISWRDINTAGALIAGSKAQLPTVIAAIPADVSLAYHPGAQEVLLTVAAFDPAFNENLIAALLFPANSAVSLRGLTISGDPTKHLEAVYYLSRQSYLIGWTPTNATTRFTYKLYDKALNQVILTPAQQPITWPKAVSDNVGTLACPATSTQPVVDLRLEELPGSSLFTDNSGYSNFAFCSEGLCPAAGVSGAPGAVRSDYGVRFDGIDDRLDQLNSLGNSFSFAFWYNSSGAQAKSFTVGHSSANGIAFTITDTGVRLASGGSNVSASVNLNNGQWRFVVATRSSANGALAIYVDGNPVPVANAATSNNPTLGSSVQIGGRQATIDQFQIYPTPLSGSAIQALYNRTAQSYCLAAGVAADGTTFPWSRFGLQQQDTRGGRIEASGELRLIIDSNLPTAQITSPAGNRVVGPDSVIGGTAADQTAGVAGVEVSINNGAWQPANGANTWSFSLAGLSGAISVRARAIDAVGNVGNPSPAFNVTIDATPPTLTIRPLNGTIKPTKNANGQWQVPLDGTITDNGRVKQGTTVVKLTQTSGVGVAQTEQVARDGWNINYLLDPSLTDPTGSYTVTVQAEDEVGNRSAPTSAVIRLDATGPVANLNANDRAREVITQTVTIGGVISDTNSIVGIDRLEIAFTPIEQIAALPADITTSAAEAQLNRVWRPVTLAQRGAGVATTTWSFPIPAGLENVYQIDLRGRDLLGNISISAGLWRGMIDTLDPRVIMTATATGATYADTAGNTQRYAVRFLCAVQDRNLDESRFVCPGEGLAEPVRSFTNDPVLQKLFPDLTIRNSLAISYTLWTPTTTPLAVTSACDSFGRCTTVSIGQPATNVATVAPTAPQAMIVAPGAGSFVAATNALSVTVAAEAGATLKEVVIRLDNNIVQTLSFAQSEGVTRTLRTIHVPVAGEGVHTLVAQATDWANATQATLSPVVFTLDQNAPTVTIDASALTVADTWQAQSGILRFNGTASDSVGLAAVQIREGDNDFVDATFGNGTWQVALPVPDPEGRTLTITVRAIDRAGRISETTQAITTVLSAADAPDTTISSGPSNPSSDNTATFGFAGSASAVAFDCQLDDGAYMPCSSPTVYTSLSKGSHTFRVRAIDSRGLPDLSPAEQSWTVNASALDVTLSTTPSNPTTSRSAAFAFTGNGSSLECSLDDAAFITCTSPQSYSGLANGDHTFQVRARSGDTVGAATRFMWTVNNAAPVANDQTVTTNQDTALAITLVANDEDALTYKVGTPAHGVLLGIPPALTYSPNTGYSGPDSFTFTAHDGLVESNVATVNITVQTVTQPTPTTTPVTPVETPAATAATTPGVPIETPTATSTNTPVVPVETPTATATTTPVAPTATATPSGTLIGTCGVYTVYKNGNTYTAAGWTGAIKVGTSSNNTLTGGSGRDLMLGLGGNDKLDGKAGDDVLCGGDGVDQVLGVAGNDYLDGGPGNDVLNGGTGDYDELLAGDGNDTLLDGDGVRIAQGGLGNDLFTLAVRNGWRDQNGQPRFTGVAAGYGNDTVALAILNLTRFFVDITGDERDDPPSPFEGANDSLALAGVIDPASTIIKFERRLVLSAEAEANIPGEEAGAEYLTEPVGDDSEVMPEAPSPVEVTTQLFLPLVTSAGTSSSSESVAPIEATPLITETTGITPTVTVTTTSTAPIDTLDAAAPVIQLYLPLVAAQ